MKRRRQRRDEDGRCGEEEVGNACGNVLARDFWPYMRTMWGASRKHYAQLLNKVFPVIVTKPVPLVRESVLPVSQ